MRTGDGVEVADGTVSIRLNGWDGGEKMGKMGQLMCGSTRTPGIAKDALEQLARSVDNFSSRSIFFFGATSNPETVSFGPFCTRALLENGCAALVGRTDPFRLLYLSEFQSKPEYEVGRRAKSSFSWTGDVVPDSEGADMWSLQSDFSKISRALFSKHSDHMMWRPAVDRMLDFVAGRPPREQLPDLLAIDPEQFISVAKGRCGQLYSSLSKGVHWEFFNTALVFDESTVKTLIRDSCSLLAQLGLVSHFIPTAHASLAPVAAFKLYRSIKKEMP